MTFIPIKRVVLVFTLFAMAVTQFNPCSLHERTPVPRGCIDMTLNVLILAPFFQNELGLEWSLSTHTHSFHLRPKKFLYHPPPPVKPIFHWILSACFCVSSFCPRFPTFISYTLLYSPRLNAYRRAGRLMLKKGGWRDRLTGRLLLRSPPHW